MQVGSELWQCCCSEELRPRLELRMMAAQEAGTMAALSPAQSRLPQSLPEVGGSGGERCLCMI